MNRAVEIRLFSLSTGQPHPLAENHLLNIPDYATKRGFMLTLAGHYLCVVDAFESCGETTRLWVWNWKTGKLHLVRVYVTVSMTGVPLTQTVHLR